MEKKNLQLDFSKQHQEECYNLAKRKMKGQKILAVLEDYYGDKLKNLSLLDVGCSTGIITHVLSERFEKTIGIDIDKEAINFAKKSFKRKNLSFMMEDAMDIGFPKESFDVILCNQVYEHVPDAKRLMSEIYRLLKPEGVCCFNAGNKLIFMEQHYNLPLLSVMPKFVAHLYLKLTKKGEYYYENHLTFWGLKKLTSDFKVLDYTKKIIENPMKYYATDLFKQDSLKQKIAQISVKWLYWLSANFIWILKKNR